MDNSIVLLAIAITAVIAGAIAWAGLRNRIPPDVAELLAEAVARLRAHLSYQDTEAIIRLYAGELYDGFVAGDKLVSAVNREYFIGFCVRAILGAQAKGAEDAETFGAMVVER